jgi:hypothetical protein
MQIYITHQVNLIHGIKNNNIFGEYNSNCNIDKPELYSDVSIGRIPVSNTTELNNYIQKVFYYENNNIES